MGCVYYKAVVPGSLMLFGEHAVLHNKYAVVAAINQYLCVKLTLHKKRQIKIITREFGTYTTTLDTFNVVTPYTYVLTAMQQYLTDMSHGFVLEITADFKSNLGFGSSAAVTVATLAVLRKWLGKSTTKQQLYQQAVKVIRTVQGFGSGADVAASIYGGVLAYCPRPLVVQRLGDSLPLVTVYSGSKVATQDVVTQVSKRHKLFPQLFNALYAVLDSCTRRAILAIRRRNWRLLGELMNIHQGLQDALGVNSKLLANLIFSLRTKKQIYGAKISGAGLGDCVIGLGKIAPRVFPENEVQRKRGIRQIDVKVSKNGILL